MKTVDELVEHMKEYNDAVIIVGPGILENKPDYTMEEFNEKYTRKNLVRNPKELWSFYNTHINKELTDKEKAIYNQIVTLGIWSDKIVDQNMNGALLGKKIFIHGNTNVYSCTKCKTLYTSNYVVTGEEECETCGAALRPTVLLSGERYNKQDFESIKESIKQAHTVFLIGMDYTEAPIMELIAEYADVNAFNEDHTKILVAVQTEEEEFNPNEMCHFNFIVKDDIEASLGRLLEKF